MFNVFSNNEKPSEQIQELQTCAGGSYTRLLIAGSEEESLYMLKPGVLDWLKWINNHILFELPRVKTARDAQWVGVRIRIATNMLNKLEQQDVLNKDICLIYHERLTSNVKRIVDELYTEDLPF